MKVVAGEMAQWVGVGTLQETPESQHPPEAASKLTPAHGIRCRWPLQTPAYMHVCTHIHLLEV